MRRRLRLVLAILIVLLIALVISAVLLLRPYPAGQAAQAALQSSAEVRVTRADGVIGFVPSTPTTKGFIYYPGGLVAPDAYAATMQDIAERGYAVFIVEMPLNLAVLGADRAADVIAAHPQYTMWAIGGHSLGGAMACRYVVGNKNAALRVLILHSGSCDQSFSLAGRDDVQVTSIYGTQDGLLSPSEVEASRQYLPASAQLMALEGVTHAQFGDYGEQRGDGRALVSNEDAQQLVVEVTVAALAALK
jgi:dienelactone hydrolase